MFYDNSFSVSLSSIHHTSSKKCTSIRAIRSDGKCVELATIEAQCCCSLVITIDCLICMLHASAMHCCDSEGKHCLNSDAPRNRCLNGMPEQDAWKRREALSSDSYGGSRSVNLIILQKFVQSCCRRVFTFTHTTNHTQQLTLSCFGVSSSKLNHLY